MRIPPCKRLRSCLLILSLFLSVSFAGEESTNKNKFRQLKQEFATPNVYRTASGAPGHRYWQQRADYDMALVLDDQNQSIAGKESVTYYNNSPDTLSYLWMQLDQNVRAQDSDTYKIATLAVEDQVTYGDLVKLHSDFDGGFKILSVRDAQGQPLKHVINKTMMRIDLPAPLQPGEKVSFQVEWRYNIQDRLKLGGRSGWEYFPDDGNYLYAIAQFYPRMAVYDEIEGWQHKQFLGRGEFTLPFGDFKFRLTVPSDHVVGATGVLQNPDDVLTAQQRERLRQAAQSRQEPVMIVDEAEVRRKEGQRAGDTKTWVFHAENVRDFAFATSRKFIWDAMGVPFGDRTVLAMSYFPKEGNPLWERYSTKVVAHTLKVFSKYTFDYPYPVAISVHTDRIGMEYPMICFNGGRPEPDGTYSKRTKYGMIGVIIHEVGHNFFPMIVNSDERQWTWMDEGLNTFLQYLTEQEWERGYPSRRGPAAKIVDYMKGDPDGIVPIMTNSESVLQFGNNAYAKPATALNILRETVMGRELFDFAFKVYSERWMFKHPSPEDFFRTMEDASGVDLDWFWRGWFYTADHVDVSIDRVTWYQVDSRDPEVEKPFNRQRDAAVPEDIGAARNRSQISQTMVEKDPALADFYNNEYDPYWVSSFDRAEFEKYYSSLDERERAALESDYNYYEIRFSNQGGLVTPLILEFEYEDSTKEIVRIPAEIWRLHNEAVSKVFATKKRLASVLLDPFRETADTDLSNNSWPPKAEPTRFQLFKSRRGDRNRRPQGMNPMQIRKKEKEGQVPTGSGSN